MINYKIVNDPITNLPMQISRNDGWQIPIDPNNKDYQEYLVWVAQGNIPQPAD